MLKRLFVDNYKTLEQFEFRPAGGISVLLGSNGSGKTTVGLVLRALHQLLVEGLPLGEAFRAEERTRWRADDWAQRFELDLESTVGLFRYELLLGFDANTLEPWIVEERVLLNDQTLYEFDGAQATLLGPPRLALPFSNKRSYLGIVDEQTARVTLRGFPALFGKLIVAKLEPGRVSAFSGAEAAALAFDGSNFSAWYRWFAANHTERLQAFFTSIEHVFGAPVALSSRDAGKQRELRAVVEKLTFSLDELSDGQRQMLILYLLLQVIERDSMVFLDEPDNFLSLREIQPWLAELDRVVEERGAQALVVSHQAEAMDYLASRAAFFFSRPEGRRTQVVQLDGSDGSMPSSFVLFGDAR